MKIKKIFTFLIFLMLLFTIPKVEAKTLRDLKNELAELKKQKEDNEAEKELTEAELSAINKNIEATANKITESENTIQKLNEEIIELNEQAEQRDLEIKEIMHFLQISSGESAYLEYIFGAKDITDFIYRSAISEQLVSYNEELIAEYNDTIKKNQEKEKELELEMEELAKKQAELEVNLEQLGSELAAISDVSMTMMKKLLLKKR